MVISLLPASRDWMTTRSRHFCSLVLWRRAAEKHVQNRQQKWQTAEHEISSHGAAMKKGYRELLDEANAEIEVVSPEEAALLLGDPGTVFIDLRDPRERDRDGKIPDAFHCTRGMLEFWIDPDSPYHKPVFASGKTFVFFCAGGWRSALATKTAQDMGLETVKHILGGFTAWKAAGLAIESANRKR
jgi:rhodanese-related sulfurtransferase